VSVAVRVDEEYVTAAGTADPLLSSNVAVDTFATFSLNVALTRVLGETPDAPCRGNTVVTVGGVVSGASSVTKTTSTQ
jgi:hypothetical protein